MTGMKKTIAEGRGRFVYGAALPVRRGGTVAAQKKTAHCVRGFLQIWSG
ncbi:MULTISPECIES: hypothetical protein [Burkholderia]|nr:MULTISPECIES: hypothetical protein [Burkholderia]